MLCFDLEEQSPDQPLRCEMQHVSLLEDQLPLYKACSYTWGETSSRKDIVIDGVGTSIPVNSELALRCLHDKHAGSLNSSGRQLSLLWMDALCIDQADVVERGQQVSLMKDIYSTAEIVLVWLGEAYEQSEAAVDSIKAVVAQWSMLSGDPEDAVRRFDTTVELDNFPDFELPARFAWEAIRAFYARPYFSRQWVIQETVLAKSAVCFVGSTTISHREVVLAASYFFYRHGDEADSEHVVKVALIHTAMINRTKIGLKTQLYTLLNLAFMLRATEPRDKVYSLLGLLPSSGLSAQAIVPDYTLSLAALYALTTKTVIREAGNLSILALVGKYLITQDGTDDDESWPSWVPKYNGVHDQYLHAERSPEWTSDIGAAGSYALRYQGNESVASVLRLSGVVVDTVTHVGMPLVDTDIEDVFDLANVVLKMCDAAAASHGRAVTDEDRLAVGYTLMAGGPWSATDRIDANDIASFERSIRAFMRNLVLITSMGGRRGTQSEDFDEQAWRLIRGGMLRENLYRRFLVTAGGQISMGPSSTCVGDKVCILVGGGVPFGMREEAGHWRLLASTYVYGIMDVSNRIVHPFD